MKKLVFITLVLAICGGVWFARWSTHKAATPRPFSKLLGSASSIQAETETSPTAQVPVGKRLRSPEPIPSMHSVQERTPSTWRPRSLAAATWQNRGALTPDDALETLFWAKDGADVKALVSLIDFSVFTEAEWRDAANHFAALSEEDRSTLGISTVEEFVAMTWALSGEARFSGVIYTSERSTDAGGIEISVQLFGGKDTLGSANFSGNWHFDFSQTDDGWQWRMRPQDIARAKRSWTVMLSLPSRSLTKR